MHSRPLREEGAAVAFGPKDWLGNGTLAPPPGTRYLDATPWGQFAKLARDDSAGDIWGLPDADTGPIAQLPMDWRRAEVSATLQLRDALLVQFCGVTRGIRISPLVQTTAGGAADLFRDGYASMLLHRSTVGANGPASERLRCCQGSQLRGQVASPATRRFMRSGFTRESLKSYVATQCSHE